jgi:hypothetical protein
MPNDTTIKSLFDYAKQPPVGDPSINLGPTVFATYVSHAPNSHPPGSGTSADLVQYANGALALSSDGKKLTGDLKVWRNIETMNFTFDGPLTPPDQFDDPKSKVTIAISISDSGQATQQRKLNGTPIGGQPPNVLNATFANAMFVEKSPSGMQSLSFTLG